MSSDDDTADAVEVADAADAVDVVELDDPPPAPPTTGRRRPRWVTVTGVAAVAVVCAGGLFWSTRSNGGSTGPAHVDVRGTIILTNAATLKANCVGTGGYGDLHAGAAVVLRDGTGRVIGRTTLRGGEPDYDDGICSYPFTFTAVPTDKARYGVEVAHRGQVLKSRAEMTQSGWTYFLALT